MGIQTEARPVDSALEAHDCGWRRAIEDQKRSAFGGNAISRAYQDGQTTSMLSQLNIALLKKIHADGYCPPTHTSPTSPMENWADHVQTDFTRS